jgi:hypothetical protein
MRIDHKHTNSRDGAGLRRLRTSRDYEQTRIETLRLREKALAEARARIEKAKRSKQ